MKKIFIFSGIVLLGVIILSTWFFIGNLGNFAQLLGRESSKNLFDEKSKFIGIWVTNDSLSEYNFKSSGYFIYNSLSGTYEIQENKTVVFHFESIGISPLSTYFYKFSSDEMMLTLTNADNPLEITTLTKK